MRRESVPTYVSRDAEASNAFAPSCVQALQKRWRQMISNFLVDDVR